MPKLKWPRKVVPSVVDKKLLAREIARIIDDNQWTQTEASYVVRDSPSQLSLIVNGKLDKVSSERLFRLLTLFGKDIDIRVRKAKGRTGKVRISVS